jgi:hypothetical protein
MPITERLAGNLVANVLVNIEFMEDREDLHSGLWLQQFCSCIAHLQGSESPTVCILRDSYHGPTARHCESADHQNGNRRLQTQLSAPSAGDTDVILQRDTEVFDDLTHFY